MTWPKLPADVIHCVFVQAQYRELWDSQQLGTCSLVCRAWCDLARPLLFSRISVKSRSNGARFFQFFDFVRSHPHLSKYVKRLVLTIRPRLAHWYKTQTEQVADEQTGGLLPLYGSEIAMLDLAAFMSTLPCLPSLRVLWLTDIAFNLHEDSELEHVQLGLEELRVHGTHCSQALLQVLHVYPRQTEADGGCSSTVPKMDSSLPVMRVRDLTLSTPPHEPHVMTFYDLMLDHQALRSLSMRAEEPETVEGICQFLPTFKAGLKSFTLDLHTYFDPDGVGELSHNVTRVHTGLTHIHSGAYRLGGRRSGHLVMLPIGSRRARRPRMGHGERPVRRVCFRRTLRPHPLPPRHPAQATSSHAPVTADLRRPEATISAGGGRLPNGPDDPGQHLLRALPRESAYGTTRGQRSACSPSLSVSVCWIAGERDARRGGDAKASSWRNAEDDYY